MCGCMLPPVIQIWSSSGNSDNLRFKIKNCTLRLGSDLDLSLIATKCLSVRLLRKYFKDTPHYDVTHTILISV
jgi:hypothetical protein